MVKVSDQELKDLITYFEGQEEKTIILFFGDHQPSDTIANPILNINRISTSNMSMEEAKLRYQVPYVLWANYDIEEETNANTDISFLAANMLKKANLPTDAYQNLLLDLEDALNEGKEETAEELLKQYEIVQYYYMFDYQEE